MGLSGRWHEMRELYNQMDTMVRRIESMDSIIELYQQHLEVCERRELARRVLHNYRIDRARLRLKLHRQDQRKLRNTVTMYNVPENVGVCQIQVVIEAAEMFGVLLHPRDILDVSRLGRLRRGPDGMPRRPARPIIVRLLTHDLQRALLIASRLARSDTSTDNRHGIYIQETLTRRNQLLLRKTRAIKRVAFWSKVSVSDGKIFVICNGGERPVHIRHVTDLYHLCEARAADAMITDDEETSSSDSD